MIEQKLWRKFTLGTLKATVRLTNTFSAEDMLQPFLKPVGFSVSEYWCAGQERVEQQLLADVFSRRNPEMRLSGLANFLSPSKRIRLRQYEQDAQGSELEGKGVCNLDQTKGFSRVTKYLQCITKKSEPWSFEHRHRMIHEESHTYIHIHHT